MTEPITIALIAGVCALLAALVGLLGTRISAKATVEAARINAKATVLASVHGKQLLSFLNKEDAGLLLG